MGVGVKLSNDVIGSAGIIDATIGGLESGLRVRHIATFSLLHCTPTDLSENVLQRPDLRDFEHIPVKEDDHCVGMLIRGVTGEMGPVRNCMKPLHDRMLVSADMPILRFLPQMAEASCRLVVDGTGISGIVTPSDLLKLPVRVCVFTLITHLEMVMAQVISALFKNTDEWFALLTERRRGIVDEKFNRLQTEKLNQSRLTFTDFCDKRDILAKQLKSTGQLPSKKKFTDELEQIEGLRNAVAHAGGYAEDQARLIEFVDIMAFTQKWIGFLAQLLPTSG
jgi:hypothetical protein